MAKVFIPHLPTRQNPLDGSWNPTISLEPASRLGELMVICDLPVQADPTNMGGSTMLIRNALTAACAGDYIMATGDPVLCAYAIHCALTHLPEIKVLRWNREERAYDVIKLGAIK